MWKMRHTSISVTTMTKDWAVTARAKALALQLPVTEIAISPVNGVHTFYVCPDGSQEGWPHAAYYEDKRKSFLEWLQVQGDASGSNPYEWALSIYGGDVEKHGGYISLSKTSAMGKTESLGCPVCESIFRICDFPKKSDCENLERLIRNLQSEWENAPIDVLTPVEFISMRLLTAGYLPPKERSDT